MEYHPTDTVRAGLASIVLIMGAAVGVEYCIKEAYTPLSIAADGQILNAQEPYWKTGPKISEFTHAFAEKHPIPFLAKLVK